MPRHTKCTPKVVKTICDAVEVGANYEDAAHAGGIALSTLNLWRSKGEEINERVQEAQGQIDLSDIEKRRWRFWKRFVDAEAQGAINAATVVYNEALRDPEYALKWLERRRPDDWALRNKHEVTGAGGERLEIEIGWGDEANPAGAARGTGRDT